MIFGFSLRVLPHFLGLRESKTWAANVAFVLWNAAIFLRYPVERLAWAASVLEAVAIVLFVWALGVFARRRTKIEIKGVDNSFAWFVNLGYAWLLIAAADPVPCRRVPPQRVRPAHHGHRVHHPADFRRELPRVADLQRRESVEQSAHARVVLASGRGQHAGVLDGLQQCVRDDVELRVVGHRGLLGVRRVGHVRDQHRDDVAHQGGEVHPRIRSSS